MLEAVCPAELWLALLSGGDPSSPSSTPGHQDSALVTPGTPLPPLISRKSQTQIITHNTQGDFLSDPSAVIHQRKEIGPNSLVIKKLRHQDWFTLTFNRKHNTDETQGLQELSTTLHATNFILEHIKVRVILKKCKSIFLESILKVMH